jgi:DNA-directed RNA polymerase subunit K/omega
MMEMPEDFDSIFRYIVVVSQRAEQLINGAKVRSETRHAKPTLAAKDDVDAGLVGWRVLTQEELDAQRQTVVDQFRAEMGPEAQPGMVRDVLPTGATTAPGEPILGEGDEGDEELARLQRLLGMVSAGSADADNEDQDQDDDEDEDGGDDEEIEEVSLEEELDLDGSDDGDEDDE